MEDMEQQQFSLRKSEPIFPVADVVATVRYYEDVLGFGEHWLWGEPPQFGGVRWGRIGMMFDQESSPAAKAGGQWHWFAVDGLDALYEFHGRNGATICSPLEAKPWAMREYTVRDLNGHYLRFGQRRVLRSETAKREPASTVSIVERLPTVEEYLELLHALDRAGADRPDRAQAALAGARLGVIALENGRVVGTGIVIGDGATFAYLKDVIVAPDWQGRGVGSRIVQAVLDSIRRTGPECLLMALFTGRRLAHFYERFGFCGPESGDYAMSMLLDYPQSRAT
jgi:GNAT superfamily N-acetyltransferase